MKIVKHNTTDPSKDYIVDGLSRIPDEWLADAICKDLNKENTNNDWYYSVEVE
jgi:hypothetical protein